MCSSSELDEDTGYTTYKSFGWSALVLARYKIDDGVELGTEWRLHIGYKMELSLTETVLDDEGNPVIRGEFNGKCDDFYYYHEMYHNYPSQCGLHSGHTFSKFEDIGTISVNYGGEVATTSFTDWCSASGSVVVEAVEV
jgi:hypothetical protein